MARLVSALEASTASSSASSKASSATMQSMTSMAASPTPSAGASPITIVTSVGGMFSRDGMGTMGTSRLNSIPRLLAAQGTTMMSPCRSRDETTPQPPSKKSDSDRQYLGPLSLLSITSEAESLAEEKLRSQSQTDRTEQMTVLGELQKVSSMAASTSSLAPRYGHRDFVNQGSKETTTLTMPPREDADMLIEGLYHSCNQSLRLICIS